VGSITGVVFAATILTIMPELFREFSDYRMPIYALALIVVMIARPQGLFGIKELWETGWWRRLIGKPNGRNGNGDGDGKPGGAPRAIARKLGAAAEPPRPAPGGTTEDRS